MSNPEKEEDEVGQQLLGSAALTVMVGVCCVGLAYAFGLPMMKCFIGGMSATWMFCMFAIVLGATK